MGKYEPRNEPDDPENVRMKLPDPQPAPAPARTKTAKKEAPQ